MKLLSTQRNTDGKQFICEDAIFDPNLMKIKNIDSIEKVISFKYDFSECGHPLNLPFDVNSVDFWVKLTEHDLHIGAIANLGDDLIKKYEIFIDEFGGIEFDVRMSTAEKFNLLLSIVYSLVGKININTKDYAEFNNTMKKIKDCLSNEQIVMNTFKKFFQ